jgi:beta-phosphoglucomutase family hydrolase
MLGLPDGVRACLFDLDGVLTPTAVIHEAAWKEMFDAYLEERSRGSGESFVPFDETDYERFVDGKPRADGVRSFLDSRGIRIPEGAPDDPPGAETVSGLGNRKNELFLAKIRAGGISPYPGSLRYLEAARDAGLRRAVVSSSANCRDIIRSAGIDSLLEVVVDGGVAAQLRLRGKPAPDTYLAAADKLGASPSASAVFEDALAGVDAGRAGAFGYVVGVDRVGQAEALKAHGASIVVKDLAELLSTP